MIGPLTTKVSKVMDKANEVIASHIFNKLSASNSDINFSMSFSNILLAAHGVGHGNYVHPMILWGNYWFLYYQAWLWNFSKSWREKVTESWLERLQDKGELEVILNEIIDFSE